MRAKISNNLIRGLIKSIIVLVPTYITAYLTDKMIYVIPMLAAACFVAASIDSNKVERRVEEDGYKAKDDG
jgi:cobalamin biosynthesis protein CobD/CbiB